METHFERLPSELIVQIFSKIYTKDDMISFSSINEKLFNSGNTWRNIFNIIFHDVEYEIITGINYSIKNYMYYLELYCKLLIVYKDINIQLSHIRDNFNLIIEDFIKNHKVKSIKDLTSTLSNELTVELNENVSEWGYYDCTDLVYKVFIDYNDQEHLGLLKIMKTNQSDGYYYDKKISVYIYHNKYVMNFVYLDRILGQLEYTKNISIKEVKTFLVYAWYNGLKS